LGWKLRGERDGLAGLKSVKVLIVRQSLILDREIKTIGSNGDFFAGLTFPSKIPLIKEMHS
jgi:hypothetical protein